MLSRTQEWPTNRYLKPQLYGLGRAVSDPEVCLALQLESLQKHLLH